MIPDCECATWATDCLVHNAHHVNCDKFDARPLVRVIHKLIKGMEDWSLDEDGIHPDAWDAYEEACSMVRFPPKTSVESA